jgi:hypothetical protein
MFDAFSRLYEGKNINRNMTLKTQLKNVKMQILKTIQSYFTRVSQTKEQLEAIGDNRRSRVGDDYIEWSPQILGIIHSRYMFKKKDNKV